MTRAGLGALVLLFALVGPARAHEVRPAYLHLEEVAGGEFLVDWKTPMRGEYRLALSPEFSGPIEIIGPVRFTSVENAGVQSWRVRVPGSLRGRTVRIAGLEGTMTDALVNIKFADGTTWVQRLTPGHPAAEIPATQSVAGVMRTYAGLGVKHILLGVDHLLFVLALLIITTSGWALVKTVTAFTVAHSITLAMATLGFVRFSPAPMEAVIALSIVFVAAEIIRSRQGRTSVARRSPWLVAFLFGLLHGFGFAGALSEIGLPAGQVPTALLFFNVGVEIGQLLFIAVVSAAIAAAAGALARLPRRVELLPPYAIGITAMFWVFQRVAAF